MSASALPINRELSVDTAHDFLDRLVLEHAGPTWVGYEGLKAPRAAQNGFAIEQSGTFGTATQKRHRPWSMSVKAEHAERQWPLPVHTAW